MNKFKSGLLFITVFLVSGLLKAQTLDEGKKFMYYERYKSAKSLFEKLVAANPNNTDAVYWLGQSMIVPLENRNLAAGKDLYQKTLMNNSNSALLLAGMGHIELLEGKVQDAKNRFETALSLSQSKNKDVLNAIGFANVHADKGDADYAIQKLKLATEIKKMNDPDVWANLGDAYKKIQQGGPAQTAYESALTLNPNYARASDRIAKIYVTQGPAQKDIYMKYFEEAITKDPAYAPGYEDLYKILYNTDVTRSGEYLEKYLANTDEDPKNCYYRASMKYAQGSFADAIKMSDDCLKSPDAYVKLYDLIASSAFKLGDSVAAKSNFETYFQKADPSILAAGDYSTYAAVLLKFNEDSLAGINTDKAVALDSIEANRLNYVKVMTAYYDAQKVYNKSGDWYSKLNSLKKDLRKTDLYNAGYSYFRGGNYPAAISIFNVYGEKFPDDPFGYYMCGKSNWAIDSTLEQGLANACFTKAIEVGSKDSVKYKAQLIGSYKYFVVYSVFKKDKTTALGYADKILALDPADAETLKNKEIIPTINFNAPAAKPKAATPATKPAASGKATKE